MYKFGVSIFIGLFCALALNFCSPQPALAFTCADNKSHNAIFGVKHYYDVLLYEEHVKVEYKFLRVVSYDIDYPTKGQRGCSISYIEALDQYTDNTGGCATLYSGGVGTNSTRIHIKSRRNYGLDFIVRIFGKK